MKHRFEGIGEKSAHGVMLLLAASSWGALAAGFWGTIIHWILKQFFMVLADRGLILGNIGVAKIQEIVQRNEFDLSMDSGWELVDKFGRKGLTDAQKKKIDDRVRAAHRKFGSFGVRNG